MQLVARPLIGRLPPTRTPREALICARNLWAQHVQKAARKFLPPDLWLQNFFHAASTIATQQFSCFLLSIFASAFSLFFVAACASRSPSGNRNRLNLALNWNVNKQKLRSTCNNARATVNFNVAVKNTPYLLFVQLKSARDNKQRML